MSPIPITLQPAVRGDKWQGVHAIGPVLINGTTPTFALARLRMQFRRAGGELGMTLDSVAGEGIYPISISNATTWLAHIPAIQPLPLTVGTWHWDLEFWATGDTAPQTYYRGTLKVLLDQTKP